MALRFSADHCVSSQFVAARRQVRHEVLRLKDVLPTEDWFFDRALRTAKGYNEKVEYIHLNAVRRGLVEHATDWK